MDRSALVVVVPEAEPLVSRLRARFDPSARMGMPAHITILFPFMAVERLTSDVLGIIRTTVASFAEFEFSLDGIGRFPQTTYLAPEPPEPFAALTAALARAFPDYQPYEGRFPTSIPHLTVADRNEAFAALAAAELTESRRRGSEVRATCREVRLMENSRGGHWRDYDSFSLRRPA
jgi:2'-5' RNA ligase